MEQKEEDDSERKEVASQEKKEINENKIKKGERWKKRIKKKQGLRKKWREEK